MLNSVKTYLLYGNRFCGVEHSLKADQGIIYTTILKKAKKTLDIETTFESDAVEILAPKLPKQQAIFLIINNDQVLTKQIEGTNAEADKGVYKAFPNINLEAFYYEIVNQGETQFVSICRKTYVNELFDTYKAEGFNIINISLGNLIASSLTSFVESKTFYTSNAKVSFGNNNISAIENQEVKESVSYNINGLKTHNHQVLSLAGALDSVIHHFQSVTNLDTLTSVLKNDYKQSRYFSQFLKMGLVLILAILLINFFVFNHYFDTVNTLQQTSQVNQTTKEKLLQLDESVSKSQKMVDDMLKSSSSKSSFYVNVIIQSLPNSILLFELNYQPLEKSIKNDKAIELIYNTIIVSGESNSSDAFSKWIANLEAMDWIHHVEILNYEDASKSFSNFRLKLIMTHDK